MKISEVMKYVSEIENGYISERKHEEDDNLIILNYTDKTTYEKRWNEQTMSARGLILDVSTLSEGWVEVVSRPFSKFFNYTENEEYESDIDFTETPEVYEKMDGSMGVTYIINGEIRIATRGSFHSEQAKYATDMLHTKYEKSLKSIYSFFDMYKRNERPSIIFEIIYPENKIVIDYGDEENLTILGIVFPDGSEICYEGISYLFGDSEFPIATKHNYSLGYMLEQKDKIDSNTEGWILKYSNGKRLKIKGDEYLKVHRAVYGMSDKMRVTYWCNGDKEDLLLNTPEEFRIELENMFEGLSRYREEIIEDVGEIFTEINPSSMSQGEFAKAISNHTKLHQSLLFSIRNEKNNEYDIVNKHIIKNYKSVLEVLKNGK